MNDATKPTSRRLHVVLLCTPARVGGLERVVQALAAALCERGHRVTVLAIVSSASDFQPFLTPFAGTCARVIPMEFGGREYARERREVARQLAELAPDVLHSHGYRADLLHGANARRAGIPTVSTLHGSSRMGGLSHFFEWLQLRALRRFDGVIPVSAPLRESLRRAGVSESRLALIPNALSRGDSALPCAAARAELGLPADGTPVIGWVGRIVQVKAADVFLEALALLPRTPWIASIVGDGPERDAMEERAALLGISDRVRFHGELDDAARVLPAFDVFVLSSRSEGTPIVVLEAMRAALPVVATAVGGVGDLLGGTGWTVPSGNPAALSAAVEAVLDDPAMAARRGQDGRQRVLAEFDPGRWAERHEEAYERAAEHRRASR